MDSNRDWTGNSKSTFGSLGASNHTEKDREVHDFYATSPKAIDALLSKEELPKNIWECACGSGCLSKRLEEYGYNVTSTDLYNNGYGKIGIDFLKEAELPKECGCILTNPPYKYAVDFTTHALNILPYKGKLCLFLRIQFLEGKERREKIFNTNPPTNVYVFSQRILCAMNGDFDSIGKGGSAACYAWFVWEKGYKDKTIVSWI